jgi:hypothetical protein
MTETKRPRRQHVTDPQLARLASIVDALAAMDPIERHSVILYVLRRFTPRPGTVAAAADQAADVRDEITDGAQVQ